MCDPEKPEHPSHLPEVVSFCCYLAFSSGYNIVYILVYFFLLSFGPSSHPVNNSLDLILSSHISVIFIPSGFVSSTHLMSKPYISLAGTLNLKKKKSLTGQGQGQNPWACKYKPLHTSTKPFISIDSTRYLFTEFAFVQISPPCL